MHRLRSTITICLPPILLALASVRPVQAESSLRTVSIGFRYGFNWSAAWTWEQLEAHVSQASPEAGKTVAHLRKTLSVSQARTLFTTLTALPNLADVAAVGSRANGDRRTWQANAARQALAEGFARFTPQNSLPGLMDTAHRLASARARTASDFLPNIEGREYHPVAVTETASPRLRLRFDFTATHALLDYLDGPSAASDTRSSAVAAERLADLPALRLLVAHRTRTQLTRDELVLWLRRAQDPDPLNRLYEWVNPSAYYDFGGLAAQPGVWRAQLAEIERHRENLQARVQARLSRYLPADLTVDAPVYFLFAADVDGWATNQGVGLDLEHFGDDFDYLARTIAHEVFHMAQATLTRSAAAIAGPPNSTDTRFRSDLLAAVWREGMASHVGAFRADLPRSAEVDDSFRQFEAAYDALYKKDDIAEFQRRVQDGLYEAAGFYYLGQSMTQHIESRLGRPVVVALSSQPAERLFARYIEAYRSASRTDIPDTQRFRPDIEAALLKMAR